MAYYWVNLGATLDEDKKLGILWSIIKPDKSPKRKQFDEIKQGDILFAYKSKKIEHIMLVKGNSYDEVPAPYDYTNTKTPVSKGTSVYAFEVEFIKTTSSYAINYPLSPLVETIFNNNKLINQGGSDKSIGRIKTKMFLSQQLNNDIVAFLLEQLDLNIDYDVIDHLKDKPTEMLHYIKIRTAQSEFKRELLRHWKNCCALTGINTQHLIASHIKPWKDSNDQERSDPYNGLPLLANYDYAFDKYLISFKNDGTMLFDTNNKGLLKELGVDTSKGLKTVYEGNKKYLTHHRDKFYETASTPSELQ